MSDHNAQAGRPRGIGERSILRRDGTLQAQGEFQQPKQSASVTAVSSSKRLVMVSV